MLNDEPLIEEIDNLRQQYLAEVGVGGGKVWPLSIKTRVFSLVSFGYKIKAISAKTQIPYETITNWVQYERKKIRLKRTNQLMPKKFEELTVTVNSNKIPQNLSTEKVATVTVTTPDGYLIEGLPVTMIVDILRARG